MSNLRKVIRALDFDQAWPDVLLAACQIEGVEYTRAMTMAVTLALADDILLDAQTLEVDVSGVSDEDVLAEVRKHVPPPPVPEPEPEPEPEPAPEPDEPEEA